MLIGNSDVADQGTDNSKTVIYAKFDGGDTTDKNVIPGCQLVATWPRNYGDIFFGADNCLYDAGGTSLNQCCSSSTITSVANPYYKPGSSPPPQGGFCSGVDTSKLSCVKDCCGYIPCPQWCVDNCGGVHC